MTVQELRYLFFSARLVMLRSPDIAGFLEQVFLILACDENPKRLHGWQLQQLFPVSILSLQIFANRRKTAIA